MRISFFALAAALAAAAPASAGTLLAINSGTETLVRIDTISLAVTVVGPLGTNVEFNGAAYDASTSTLYATGGRGNNSLYTVNTTTGAATLVGVHGINDLFGLEVDSSTGKLYASQFSGGSGLFELNKATGAATTINAAMTNRIGGLAYDSIRDQLVGIEDGAGSLYSINRATGAQALLTNGGGFVNDSGLAYDGDLDLLWDIDYSGNLFTFNPNAAYGRTTKLTGLGPFTALAYQSASNAVPEPATWAMMIAGFGLAGSTMRVRRRKAVVA